MLVAAQRPDFDGSSGCQGQDDIVVAVSRSQNVKCRNPEVNDFFHLQQLQALIADSIIIIIYHCFSYDNILKTWNLHIME